MYTGTNDKKEILKIVEDFLNYGYTNIEIKKDSLGQWIISTKD